jgi:hypothetical protein
MRSCKGISITTRPLIRLTTSQDSFTQLPILSERFSHAASSQYHAYVPTLSNLKTYIQDKLCHASSQCKDGAASLLTVSYMDIDYDTISHAVILNAYWEESPITETISLSGNEEKIEAGVLIHEPNPDPEDIGFGGFLTVLGEDDKPSNFPLPTFQPKAYIPRTDTFPNPHQTLPPPGPSKPPNIPHALVAAHRPPPYFTPYSSCRSHPASTNLQTTRPPHPPLGSDIRQVPIHRPPLPLIPQPRCFAKYSRGHGFGGSGLGGASMGIGRLIPTWDSFLVVSR